MLDTKTINPVFYLLLWCVFIMEFMFEIKGNIRNFTKEEFSKMLDILGQCGIDNFAELVKLYEERYGCKR